MHIHFMACNFERKWGLVKCPTTATITEPEEEHQACEYMKIIKILSGNKGIMCSLSGFLDLLWICRYVLICLQTSSNNYLYFLNWNIRLFLEILIQHTASGCGITPQYSDQRCYFEILRNLTIVGYVSIQLYELILGHTKIAVLVTIKRNKSVTEENIHFLKLLPSIRHRWQECLVSLNWWSWVVKDVCLSFHSNLENNNICKTPKGFKGILAAFKNI